MERGGTSEARTLGDSARAVWRGPLERPWCRDKDDASLQTTGSGEGAVGALLHSDPLMLAGLAEERNRTLRVPCRAPHRIETCPGARR